MFRDLLSTQKIEKDEVEKVLETAEKLLPVALKQKTSNILQDKILAALFYEPSTRTRLSFETAMQRLGGRVLTVAGMEGSSLTKGETLHDTAKVIENFADVIAVRHPTVGSAREIADAAGIPVINAGDGSGEHPSQAFLDMFTIKKERGTLEGLTVAFVGDLKFGRTPHSLIYLLALYKANIILVSPKELRLPSEMTTFLRENNISFRETEDMNEALKEANVLYMARIQKERFSTQQEYERFKGCYILSRELIERYNENLIVMHALPRVDEITLDVDGLKGAAYFRQVQNGVATRMALLSIVLGKN